MHTALVHQLEALRLEVRAAATLSALTAGGGKLSNKSINEGVKGVNDLRQEADNHAQVAREIA